jgi:hypothetical protein
LEFMEEVEEVNLLELGSKAQSKYELYKMLTNDGEFYLPPYKECTVKFIAEMLKDNKKVGSSSF